MNEMLESAEARRRRQYRRTSRVLREYTARVDRLIARLSTYLDTPGLKSTAGPLPWAVAREIFRFQAICQPLTDLTLFASQMLIHFQLDEAEKADLTLRLADAEHAILNARAVCVNVAKYHKLQYSLPEAAPTHGRAQP